MAEPAPYALIAQSDLRLSALLKSLVESEKIEPIVVGDGDEAWRVLRGRGAPALILTDLALPKLDGFELLFNVRKSHPLQSTPAIVVSPFVELRVAASRLKRELGIQEILGNGASVEALRRATQRALSGTDFKADAAANYSMREQYRQGQLETLPGLRDPVIEPALQQLVAEAARALQTPTSALSILLGDGPFFKAQVGFGKSNSPTLMPDWPFCRHVVDSREPLLIVDAAKHALFARSAYVKQGAVKGYAGTPVVLANGHILGVLCVTDKKPLRFGPRESQTLQMFARRAAGAIELLRQAGSSPRTRSRNSGASHGTAALAAILSHLEDGVLFCDERGKIIFTNATLAGILSTDVEKLIGFTRNEFVHRLKVRVDDSTVGQGLWLSPNPRSVSREDIVLVHPRHRVLRWSTKPVSLGKRKGQLEIFCDVTDQVEAAKESEKLALTDFLTGLWNRRAGEEAIAREAARASRTKAPLAFVMLDLDLFKKVNDTFGHAVGDKVLCEVSRVLDSNVRGSDLAVRWGGEELLAVLTDTRLEGAWTLAERVRMGVEAIDIDGCRVTVSAGVSELRENESVEDAVARADARLYEAKSAGRNRVK